MKPLYHVGKYVLLMKSLFVRPEKASMYWKEIIRQMNEIGIGSLGIIITVSLFIGAVTSIQFAYQMMGTFIPMWWVGYIVRDSMILELAPTICSLLLAGKVGSSIATELGTMRISEQIDALEIMGVNTPAYLILPKIIASLTMVPLLIIVSAFIGIWGGLFAGWLSGIFTSDEFVKGVQDNFLSFNLTVMLIKSVTFGFIVTSVASYQGFYARGGALEIGRASTRAVVVGCIAILVSDYLLAWLLL